MISFAAIILLGFFLGTQNFPLRNGPKFGTIRGKAIGRLWFIKEKEVKLCIRKGFC